MFFFLPSFRLFSAGSADRSVRRSQRRRGRLHSERHRAVHGQRTEEWRCLQDDQPDLAGLQERH